jgi:hypothetical protein
MHINRALQIDAALNMTFQYSPHGATVLRSETPTGCQIGIYPSSLALLIFCVELSGLFILPVLVYMAPFLCKVVCGGTLRLGCV